MLLIVSELIKNSILKSEMGVHKREALNYLIVFVLCWQVQRVVGASRAFREFISDPIIMTANDNKVVQHTELPEVIDEVSVTLRLNILSYYHNFTCVFHKGITSFAAGFFGLVKVEILAKFGLFLND
jgi:hypothetical protein